MRADELTNNAHNKLVMLPDGRVFHLARLRLSALQKVYEPGDTLYFSNPGQAPQVIKDASPSGLILDRLLGASLFNPLSLQRDVSILDSTSGYFYSSLSGFPYAPEALDGTNRIIYVGTPLQAYASYQPATNPFQPPCNQVLNLTTGQWQQVSMACNPGESDTVGSVFHDDLTGTYGTDWIVYRRDEASMPPSYVALGLGDALAVGEAYWIKTLQAGNPSVDISGIDNTQTSIALTGVTGAGTGCAGADGQCNMVGHPHNFNVCWADVMVRDGGSILSLSDADSLGIMDREAHKWNGSVYEAFNGLTPGLKGTLEPWDGLWVSANKPGIELIIPASPAAGSCDTVRGATRLAGAEDSAAFWFIRLTAESGTLADRGNVFGRAKASVDGYDAYDLQELEPFGDDYLTVVFPQPDWGEQSGNYTSDYRSSEFPDKMERWDFEVHASDPKAEVVLRWDGEDTRLTRSVLIDRAAGAAVSPGEDGKYPFRMQGNTRQFSWYYNVRRGSDISSLLDETPAPKAVTRPRIRSGDELRIAP